MRPSKIEIIDWDEVHRAVQAALEALSERVRRCEPAVRCRPGRTSGGSFPLFSYRTFDRPGDEDRVIVGITVQDQGERFRIVGEISGEESGLIFVDGGAEPDVPRTLRDVLDSVDRIAPRLAPRDREVIGAIDRVSTNGSAIRASE